MSYQELTLKEALLPFPERNFALAQSILEETGISPEIFIKHLQGSMQEFGLCFFDLDLTGQVYECVLKQVESEVFEKLGRSLRNETNIHISVNDVCTSFQLDEEANEISREIPEEERSKALVWFLEKTG